MTFNNRADAQLAQSILAGSGFQALVKQDAGTEALSVVRGNATLPFEGWGIYVDEKSVAQAKELLEDKSPNKSEAKVKETLARRIVKPIIWLFLALFITGILISVWQMFKYILHASNL